MLFVISLHVGCLCAIDLKLVVADVVSISDSFFKSVFGSSADKQLRWEHSHDLWKTHSYVPAFKPPLFSYGKDDHQPYSRVSFTHPKDSLSKVA